MTNMGERAAWRMLNKGLESRPRVKRMAVDRVIPTYNEGMCNWPENSPYGSLTFHAHIKQLVALWNEFPTVDNPSAVVDASTEAMGYTVVHFDTYEECGQFCFQNTLHDAIVAQNFGEGGGYVQIRNSFPKEFIDSFLQTIAQGNNDLQIAVNRVRGMMEASRTAMFSMTKQMDNPNI